MDKSQFKNVRVGYSVEATVNVGDFQNVKPGFTIFADVADGASPTEAKDFLVSVVDGWMESEVDKARNLLK